MGSFPQQLCPSSLLLSTETKPRLAPATIAKRRLQQYLLRSEQQEILPGRPIDRLLHISSCCPGPGRPSSPHLPGQKKTSFVLRALLLCRRKKKKKKCNRHKNSSVHTNRYLEARRLQYRGEPVLLPPYCGELQVLT